MATYYIAHWRMLPSKGTVQHKLMQVYRILNAHDRQHALRLFKQAKPGVVAETIDYLVIGRRVPINLPGQSIPEEIRI